VNEVVYGLSLNVAFEFMQLYRSTDTVGNLTNAFQVIILLKGVTSTQLNILGNVLSKNTRSTTQGDDDEFYGFPYSAYDMCSVFTWLAFKCRSHKPCI